MTVFQKVIQLNSKGQSPTFINITSEVHAAIAESQLKNGIIAIISPHTTCSVFFEEFAHDMNEEGVESLQEDLNNALKKIIPDHTSADTYIYPGEEHYKAVEAWPNVAEYLPDGDRSALWNGDAHLKATLIGSSDVFGLEDGKLAVGQTGYIYFVDFDTTRPRQRKCRITIIGE